MKFFFYCTPQKLKELFFGMEQEYPLIYFPVIRELYHCTETCGFREEDIQEAITRFGALPSVLWE